MWSVCSRRRLASIEVIIFLRWLPALFGSPGSVWLVNLVASTNRSRRPLSSSPRMVSGPVGIDVGGVDGIAASVGEQVQHPRADIWGCPPAPVFTEGHGAQRHLRDPHAGLTQKPVTHKIPSLLWIGNDFGLSTTHTSNAARLNNTTPQSNRTNGFI